MPEPRPLLESDLRYKASRTEPNPILEYLGVPTPGSDEYYFQRELDRIVSVSPPHPLFPIRKASYWDPPPQSEDGIKAFLIERDGLVCAGCSHTFDERQLEVDHIQPKSKGGADDIRNRTLLCRICNLTKSDRFTLPELRALNRAQGRMLGSG